MYTLIANDIYSYNYRVLNLALETGNEAVLKLLVSNASIIGGELYFGRTLLDSSVTLTNSDTTRIMIKKGVNVNKQD